VWNDPIKALALSLALIVAPARALAQDEPEEIRLDLGEQTTLPTVGVERFSEGVEGIVDVRVTAEQFILVGLRPGQTTLLLIYTNGRQVRHRIVVTDPNATNQGPGTVTARENIRLDLYFVELNEAYSHQIGLAWPGTVGGDNARANMELDFINGGPAGPGGMPTAGVGITEASLSLVNQVLPRLDIAQSSGWARLRRQAMLVTANGTPARFNTGGEVNVLVQGALVAEIRSIEFGSELRMTPRYDSTSGRIEIQMNADLSELSAPQNPGDPPGRRRTELQSVVNLEPGQAIIMSGIVSRSEAETQGGLPGLSQIPIVGVLFGSNQRRGEHTTNLLFIVPTIVQAVPRRERDYIREALEVYERFSGHIHDVELFERVPPGYGEDAQDRTP
jgi:pilus assembly protein CpaC